MRLRPCSQHATAVCALPTIRWDRPSRAHLAIPALPPTFAVAGENYAPLDWLFGTFAANEADFQAKFGRLTIEPAGEGTEAGADAAGDPPRSGGATSGAGATVSGDLRRRPGSSKDVKAGMRT